MFVLASCKKDRTCTCSDNDGTSDSYTIKKSTKKDAEKACNVWSPLYDKGCSIK